MVSALPVFVVLPPCLPLAATLPQASPESFRLRFLVVCFVFGLRAGQCPGSQGLSMSDCSSSPWGLRLRRSLGLLGLSSTSQSVFLSPSGWALPVCLRMWCACVEFAAAFQPFLYRSLACCCLVALRLILLWWVCYASGLAVFVMADAQEVFFKLFLVGSILKSGSSGGANITGFRFSV